jgi:5-formyltetrahydrofolate cyclo-ligase
LQPVDLVVCGSVAVNREGTRVGKGGGFSDLWRDPTRRERLVQELEAPREGDQP